MLRKKLMRKIPEVIALLLISAVLAGWVIFIKESTPLWEYIDNYGENTHP
jgi:hypothetical protein